MGALRRATRTGVGALIAVAILLALAVGDAAAVDVRRVSNGGPMCAAGGTAVRVRIAVRPRSETTVAGVIDPYLAIHRITGVDDTWLLHLRTPLGVPTLPAHTVLVVVHTTSRNQTFPVPVDGLTCPRVR